MSSPSSLRHSVSDPNLPTKSHTFPDTSHTTLSSKPSSSSSSSSSSTIAKLKLCRKTSTHDLRNGTYDLNNFNHGEPWVSPYYRGLLDQSLAINNNNNNNDNNNNNNQIQSSLLSSGGHSPYYKGLTDFSLVLHGPPPPPLPPSVAPEYTWRSTHNQQHEVEGVYECSPYYRGLTDFTLALRELESYGHHGSSSSSLGPQSHTIGLSPFAINWGLCLRYKQEFLEKATEATAPNQAAHCNLSSGKTDLNVEQEVEKKRLGERESEDRNNIEKENALNMEKNEVMNEYGLEGDHHQKEKSLRESVSISEQTVVASDQSSCKDGAHLITQQMKIIAEEEGSEKEYNWANKYQPKALADFICHRHIVTQLQAMIKEGCACNHFIFEGPPGVGKRSMIRAMLREVFGQGIEVTEEDKTFNLKGEMIGSIQVRIKKSAHHVEVNLSETKGYEKHVIVDLFRETYDKIVDNSLPCTPQNCQAIIIYEAQKLSIESVLYIKWMLDRHKGCNKVFFCCCSDESKLQTIKPLCTTVCLSSPSSQEIVEVLEYIGKEEGKEVSREFLMKVVDKSKSNLRQAIRSLEATCQNKDSIEEDELILTGWEDDISNIAKNIIKEQSPRQLYIIHLKLRSLMIHNVSPDFVYKRLVSELNSLVDESLRPGVAKLDKDYNILKSVKQSGHAQNKEGESDERNNELPKKIAQKSYLKVEEFIAKFMSWYKNINASSKVEIDVGA